MFKSSSFIREMSSYDFKPNKKFRFKSPCKKMPKCFMIIIKENGCNRMTCPNCRYVWCWLCHKKCNYNHYKYGNCQGKDFNEDEIKEEYLDEDENKNYFGLHKIFKCIFKQIDMPKKMERNCFLKYLLIILFWIFGFFIFYMITICDNLKNPIKFKNNCFQVFFGFFSFFTGVALFISFQISFTCCITPFILIALIYPKFYQRISMFFGIGKSKGTKGQIKSLMFIYFSD